MAESTGDATLDFGEALRALRAGFRVTRRGWNGKDMWLSYAPGGAAFPPIKQAAVTVEADNGRTVDLPAPDGRIRPLLPFIVMRTARGEFVPWLASQSDLLSFDWVALGPGEG